MDRISVRTCQVTRRDYIFIAEALRNGRPHYDLSAEAAERIDGWKCAVSAVANALAERNAHFDVVEFVNRCDE